MIITAIAMNYLYNYHYVFVVENMRTNYSSFLEKLKYLLVQ